MSDRGPQYSESESKPDLVPLTKAQLAIACKIEADTPEMCPHLRMKDECGFCAADEHRAGLERRIECEKIAAVQEFMDAVLGALNRMGIKTDDCDGEDAPEVIFSGWIYHQIEHARTMSASPTSCDAQGNPK